MFNKIIQKNFTLLARRSFSNVQSYQERIIQNFTKTKVYADFREELPRMPRLFIYSFFAYWLTWELSDLLTALP